MIRIYTETQEEFAKVQKIITTLKDLSIIVNGEEKDIDIPCFVAKPYDSFSSTIWSVEDVLPDLEKQGVYISEEQYPVLHQVIKESMLDRSISEYLCSTGYEIITDSVDDIIKDLWSKHPPEGIFKTDIYVIIKCGDDFGLGHIYPSDDTDTQYNIILYQSRISAEMVADYDDEQIWEMLNEGKAYTESANEMLDAINIIRNFWTLDCIPKIPNLSFSSSLHNILNNFSEGDSEVCFLKENGIK